MDSEQQKEPRKPFWGLNSVILVLGIVSLMTDLSSQMIVPILPLYLTSILHVQVGTLGIIEGIAESTASILKFFSGWVSDRFGKRKWLMVGGYGLSNLIKPFSPYPPRGDRFYLFVLLTVLVKGFVLHHVMLSSPIRRQRRTWKSLWI